MYKKYTTPLPFYGMWGSRKTSWDGSANNNNKSKSTLSSQELPVIRLPLKKFFQRTQSLIKRIKALGRNREKFKAAKKNLNGIWPRDSPFAKRKKFLRRKFRETAKIGAGVKIGNGFCEVDSGARDRASGVSPQERGTEGAI